MDFVLVGQIGNVECAFEFRSILTRADRPFPFAFDLPFVLKERQRDSSSERVTDRFGSMHLRETQAWPCDCSPMLHLRISSIL